MGEKTKWHSTDPSSTTPGVDQQTGVRHADAPGKGAEPRRGSSGRGAALAQGRKPKWGNRISEARNPQPHAKPPPQEEVSQPESARCGTPEGTPAASHTAENRRCPRKIAEQSHQKRFSKSLPHPQQEERIHNSAATEKTPHTNIGTSSRVQRQDPDPHTPTCEPPKNPASS